MSIASSTITAVMRHGWENKREAVGHSSFVICDQQPHKHLSCEHCRSWVTQVCTGAVVSRINAGHHDACEVAGSCGVSLMSALAISNAPDLMLKQVNHLPQPTQSWQSQLLKLSVFISCWKCVCLSAVKSMWAYQLLKLCVFISCSRGVCLSAVERVFIGC